LARCIFPQDSLVLLLMPETSPIESPGGPPPRRFSYAWTMMILSVFASLATLFMTFHLIPLFEGLYRDMLGDQRLPAMTEWVLHGRLAYMSLAVFWPAMAVWEFWQRTRWFGGALITVTAIEVLFTFVALVQPIVGTIVRQAPAAG
jgi:hypothetical protein